MTDINNIVLVGRLVKDPQVRYSATGTPILRATVAVNESIKKNNEWQDYANFFDFTAFGNTASNCEKYLRKGSQIAVNGTLRQTRWADKTTNQARSKIEIIASSIQFLSKSESSGTAESNNYVPIQDPWSDADISQDNSLFSSDIPF